MKTNARAAENENSSPHRQGRSVRAMQCAVLMVVACAVSAGAAHAQSPGIRAQTEGYRPAADDVAAVERAGFGYIDAIYKADASLVERYVHPSLVKVGYYTTSAGAWTEAPMTYAQLLDVARTWNRGGTTLRADAPREVVIYEVLDRTASAKVIAQWGIDYLQLVKYEDGWKIRHIVWQQHPGRAGARGGAS